MARNGECIIMEDFYGHMGSFVDGFEGIHGGCGQQSQEDERILELADSIKMIAGNILRKMVKFYYFYVWMQHYEWLTF